MILFIRSSAMISHPIALVSASLGNKCENFVRFNFHVLCSLKLFTLNVSAPLVPQLNIHTVVLLEGCVRGVTRRESILR